MDPAGFEHMVNMLTLRVLGAGSTGFGPGPDGGRDGYFEGEASYPSTRTHWSGIWYIQTKFHAPHLSADPQRWLLDRIEEEIVRFQAPNTRRVWPDNWIIATNIDPSGAAQTGAFDKARKLVRAARPRLANRFHIWGGSKILGLLTMHPEVARRYLELLTPGEVLASVFARLGDAQAEIDAILRELLIRQLGEQKFTKLDQAGSAADDRPGVHELFIDLPFEVQSYAEQGLALQSM
jgi:hypothetical protein